MALIRNKSQQAKAQQQQQTVGSTYGERRQQVRSGTSKVATQRQQAPKPLDKFADNSGKRSKAGLAGFAANATFQAARRFSVTGKPYVRPRSEHLNNGTAQARGHKEPPSDKAILNFLNKVIDKAPVNPRIARNRAAKQAAVSSRTRPQAPGQQLGRTARTRTTKA